MGISLVKIKTNTVIRLEGKMDTEATSELVKGLLTDFQKSTSLHILNKVVFLVQQALGQLSAASTSQFTALTTLVDALYGRFNHSYDLTDLDDAISSLQDASKHCMEQDCQESNITFWISGLLATQSDLMRDISDLQMAWDWTIQGTKTSTSILESLEYATELCKEFEMSGNMADLNSAVTLFREGIAELPQGSENYAVFINNFVSALLIRYKQGGQQSDLNEGISLHRQALELFLPPHPNQSASLNNLASALLTRF